MMNIAAILSGGTGRRAEADMPKQWIDLGGKMMIERTIEVFDSHPLIDEVVVVSHSVPSALLENIRPKFTKWHQTVRGGSERYLSSWAAVRACEGKEGNLLIHDAARPCISPTLISRVITALIEYPAVVPVLPLSDTLIEADGDCVKCVHDRQKFRNAQTPQAFRLSVLRKVFPLAINSVNPCFTDDCSVVLRYLPELKVKMVDGEIENQKLTYHRDIEYFRNLFQKNEGEMLRH